MYSRNLTAPEALRHYADTRTKVLRHVADYLDAAWRYGGAYREYYARRAMYAGNLAAARDGLESLQGAKLTALQQEECRVQAEVCEAAAALYALLNRRSGGKFNPADDMEKQGILLASLSLGNKFKGEATALILMMHGDYAKAFASYPYRNDAASQEPFAVIMRDWRKRLGFK